MAYRNSNVLIQTIDFMSSGGSLEIPIYIGITHFTHRPTKWDATINISDEFIFWLLKAGDPKHLNINSY